MEDNQEQPRDPQEPTDTKPAEAPIPEDGSEREKPVEEATTGGEKEEEEAFLVSLYKFMKDRHTPIERIPHLGFKQINLWKIYKAVEKLGAYELVTGRRLWKNVYDELGGSPGSTSAATCTRRHYERLVLPYVRHLKGEDDKPLPPSKPRKQYKVSKGTETGEKSKRAKKEKGREQMPPDKAKPEVAAGTEDARDAPERGRAAEGCSSPVVPTPSPSEGCPGPCRTHPETYKRLFSSFYSKGNHPIMSPLAKKKLLAQVSKAESLPCHKRHHPEGRQPASDAGPEPPRPATGPHLNEQRSPEPSGAQDTAPSVGNEVGPITSASPGGRDSQHCPRAEDGCPAPAVFTGCFHAYRNEVLKPVGCHPLWGYFSSLKDFLEPPSTFPSRAEEPEQPQDLRGCPDPVGKEVLFRISFGGIAAVLRSGCVSKCEPAQPHLQVLFASRSSCRAVANDPKASSELRESLFLVPAVWPLAAVLGASPQAVEAEKAEGWWHLLVRREVYGFRWGRSSKSALKDHFCCIHGKEKLWDRNWKRRIHPRHRQSLCDAPSVRLVEKSSVTQPPVDAPAWMWGRRDTHSRPPRLHLRSFAARTCTVSPGLCTRTRPRGSSLRTWSRLHALERGHRRRRIATGGSASLSIFWWRNRGFKPCHLGSRSVAQHLCVAPSGASLGSSSRCPALPLLADTNTTGILISLICPEP